MLAVKHNLSVCVFAQVGYIGLMTLDSNNFRSPGQFIQALLDQRGWTQRTLAVVMEIGETTVNRITSNKQPIDAGLSLILEEVFEIPAERFLALQKDLDLAQARILASPDPSRATRALLYGDLPVSEMIKRGWIDAGSVKDTKKVELGLMRFFGVNRLDDIIEILPHAAKKTEVNTPLTPAQLAWLYRVKQIASDMLVAPYSPQALVGAIGKLRKSMQAAEDVANVPRVLMECGVRFVIVESLPSAKIDGVCFWLNERSPVIAMTLRFDRIDNFWFVLRHEIEHVLQMHGTVIDVELEGDRAGTGEGVPEEERVANLAAQEFCVPESRMDAFVVRKAPFFAERDLIAFARILKVHPGIVAGQLQRKTGRYDRFRDHLVKVRAIISPNAIKDGWGDVAPVGI